MKKNIWIILLAISFINLGFSQGKFVIQNKKESDKIRFKLINNLIIIPVEINGIELSFLLDTGVNKSIIFNFLNITDTLQIKNTETFFLRGLGEGEAIKALKSKGNILKVGDAININQELFAVYNPNLNFAPRLGIPLHGIIGYDLFKDFVVEINYTSKYIRLTNPDVYNYKACRSCETLNMEFYKNKPYVYAKVKIKEKQIPVKLLIDSGGSDALWLFEDDSLGIEAGKVFFDDFLGHGLTGSVYGKRSKIDGFSINHFNLNHVNVSFPDPESLVYVKQHKDRNGSIAGNVLKRFNLIVDYPNKTMTFDKNRHFQDPFSYNKSGIELEQNAVRLIRQKDYNYLSEGSFLGSENNASKTSVVLSTKYKLTLKPAYSIVELRKDSPAHQAGLMIGDVLLSINNKSTDRYTLQEVMHMFYDKDGQRIKLEIEREGVVLVFVFYLKDVFKP
ncbi:aspartyl protease family protein [Xanthomarina sp. F2636L]|uniref:aspartyl protease family protein n=1 Tax=Xanthomarina sp. F2636L TaxID=2996018 RepID=UPI00225DD0F5|nr:aspartyl protease family protein [Xanthomarina sp. F2636L]MCX7550753.1 aspartyl protease family protein [Xanthomarina sp. F2636L]